MNGEYLRDRDFSAQNLQRADFKGADLRSVNFRGANLEGAEFEGAYLKYCDFRGANMYRVNMRRAHSNGSNFEFAELGEANFDGSHLYLTVLAFCRLRKSTFYGASFETVDLTMADLTKVDRDELASIIGNSEWPTLTQYVLQRTVERMGADANSFLKQYSSLLNIWPGTLQRLKLQSRPGTSYADFLKFAGSQHEGYPRWQWTVDALELSLPSDEQDLKTMHYAAYLETEHWKETRAKAIERAGGRCQICNSSKRLHVHHRTYERRGFEADGDLTVLCSDCHQLFHENGKLDAADG